MPLWSRTSPSPRLRGGRSEILDVSEARLLYQRDLIPDGDRPAHSLRPGFEATGNVRKQGLVLHDVRELEPAARAKDAVDLLEDFLLRW